MTATLNSGMPEGLRRWVAVFEQLSPQALETLEEAVTADVRFCDPFHDVRGVAAVRQILQQTVTHAPDARFTVHGVAQPDPQTAYLHWTMTATVPVLGPWTVTGMSVVTLAPDGRVAAHVDHWDASVQFYQRLPVIGGLLARLRRTVARRMTGTGPH
ncbi:nuclear transport factor 2 family protein [Novispirillum itersonii]|uniref:nuclear transport factor 2 family protein n=1 Tax=Novispirillum itersonii TaxID=189 RepID=UPI000368BB48|nr:nuclear transport factor 2 family protein [Novispirillum itersonii]